MTRGRKETNEKSQAHGKHTSRGGYCRDRRIRGEKERYWKDVSCEGYREKKDRWAYLGVQMVRSDQDTKITRRYIRERI